MVTNDQLLLVTAVVVLWLVTTVSIPLTIEFAKEPLMVGTISKALIALVALIVANLWAQLTATGAVLPHNVSGWVALLATSIGGTFLVWLKSNNPFKSKTPAE